jgi:E3 ubiquitin-protein ligase HECTD2
MPSLALGKLLSSNSTKTNSVHDVSTKKPRVRSYSEKRINNDASQIAKLPTPPNTDRFPSDSYFAAARRRTPRADENYNETDDYGFPVVDRLHLQQIADDMQELSKTMLRGKCRTCNKAFQAPAMAVWKCDQCYTANGISSGTSRADLDRPVKPLSSIKTQDAIDQLIEDGLKTLESMKPDGLEVPGYPQSGNTDTERPTRRSTLVPPRPSGPLAQRRGSAPDSSRPNLQFHNGSTEGRRPSTEGRPKQAMRRKSPGPIAFQGGRGPRTSTHGSPVIGPAHGFNPDPPSPFLNGESSSPKLPSESHPRRPRVDLFRDPFQSLFDYLSQSLKRPNLNISFSTIRGHHHGRSAGDPNSRNANKGSQDTRSSTPPPQISQMDHKDLMIGDVYDVASSLVTEQSSPSKRHVSKPDPLALKLVSQGSPHIDWRNLARWYETVLTIGLTKKDLLQGNDVGDSSEKSSKSQSLKRTQILEDLGHVVRGQLLDLAENLLVIPQQAPSEPQDIRYLLILLANPLLISSKDYPVRNTRRVTVHSPHDSSPPNHRQGSPSRGGQRSYNHSKKYRVLSLLLGVIANLPSDCHTFIIQWLSRYPEDIFRKHVDMLLAFVNERVSIRGLTQKSSRKSLKSSTYHGVPTSQMFDDVLKSDIIHMKDMSMDDWQLRSACKVLQLFVRANDIFQVKSGMTRLQASFTTRRRPVVKQLIPTEYFYVSQLDSEDKLDAPQDFDDWEKKETGFQITQYPFLLTLGTKMRILEADGRKKMASKARQEFFDSIMRHTSVDKFFHLKVRRTCIIEDSLQRISEAISSSEGEAKKALKVHFEGEEGIDAGGLRKEWFLILVRELLDPALGKLTCLNQ